MLNRRILRIKAFKVLYSYAENPTMTLKEAEAQLEISCEATRDLYLYMLGLVPALTAEARNRIEAARNKFNPTPEEKNPNMKFADNGIAVLLSEDPDYQKLMSRKKMSWEQNDAFLRKLYDTLRTRDYYAEYMSGDGSSLKDDAWLFIKIFENELVDSDELDDILDDMSINWNGDLAYALTFCCRTMEDLAATRRWNLPALYMSDLRAGEGMESDKAFVFKLLRTAFNGFERYSAMVADAVEKWDKDRLFVTDVALIVAGLAEVEAFSGISPKVVINEYVEISKYYSTPKSRSFVNGLLDRIIKNQLSL